MTEKWGLNMVFEGNYDLIVLDVMLPVGNGFEVLRRLRAGVSTPVVMLTARGDDVDRIIGLEMGADDYLPKPFNPRELLARIRAVLRRVKQEPEERTLPQIPEELTIGDVKMDMRTREVIRSGEKIDLTNVEFGLLEILLHKSGRLVSREELMHAVLGRSLSPYDRSIDVHISKLRKKLGHEVSGKERIKTIRGVGYLYTPTPPPDHDSKGEYSKEPSCQS